MNQLSDLLVKGENNYQALKVESKQDFFTTKRNLKRMKSSTCFSQAVEKRSLNENSLDFSLASLQDHSILKI